MSIPLTKLTAHFGSKSAIAQQLIPQLYEALSPELAQFQAWQAVFFSIAPKQLKTVAIARDYGLEKHDSTRLVFTLQSYYAIVIKLLAAYSLQAPESPESVENGSHFRQHGINNFTESMTVHTRMKSSPNNDLYDVQVPLLKYRGEGFRGWGEQFDVFSWYLDLVDIDLLSKQVTQVDFSDAPPDALKALYHDLFPRVLRHTLGEYYTPDWLAEHTLNRLDYHGNGRLLDPACGSGTFLIHALRRLQNAGVDHPLNYLAGIDLNPLACLSAKVNLLLATENPPSELPIYCADSLFKPPEIGQFDYIAGNPPWVNWETLPIDYRQATKYLWEQYQLFPHTGFESILGKGKKDISLLLTYVSMDNYLADTGKLGFIITEAALKSGGAGEGFRRFQIGDSPIAVLSVDDMSRIRPFAGAETRTLLIFLQKGEKTNYPVPYYLWDKPGRGQTIKEELSLKQVQSIAHVVDFVAEPISEPNSPWMSGRSAAIPAMQKLIGKSDYHAHAGVYTGGANAVYWLEIIGQEGDLLQVRNDRDGSKLPVKQVEALIEPDFIYPLLRGRDLNRWQALPTAHILLVQNPETRQGYDPDWLEENYPLTYTYLVQFEEMLRSRATFKRYFKKQAPFYSMFDVGDYTFAPYKVVWKGFGTKTMQVAVIDSIQGKPIMTNQAMHPFIGLDNEDEAHYIAACLNSAPFEYAVISHTQAGGKSFAQAGILERLQLPIYDASNTIHDDLMQLSRAAHHGEVDNDTIAKIAAALWGISSQELAHVLTSLEELR
jgi:SAM-dependent methyltransferase